jgi:bifunctional NMN adenylyltransferase/nudix hydrolase
MTYDYSIVIGRFQLPHKAHFELLHKALEIGHKVIVCLGSSNVRRNLRNPFNVEQRMSLIQAGSNTVKNAISNGRLIFVPIEDSYYSDQWWVEHVQRQVKAAITRSSIVSECKDDRKLSIALVGHKKDDTSYYLDMFPQWKYEGIESKTLLSSTECRETWYKYGLHEEVTVKNLRDFTTSGVIEYLRYFPDQSHRELQRRYEFVENYHKEWGPGPHYTADTVVVKSGHILLIQRGEEPDIGSWAFPGGFANQNENIYNTAVRECLEETGLDLKIEPGDPWKYMIASQEYNKPFRDDRGDIRTTALLFDLGTGPLPEVKGQDDAANAEWVPLADLTASNMYGDHYFIFRDLIKLL